MTFAGADFYLSLYVAGRGQLPFIFVPAEAEPAQEEVVDSRSNQRSWWYAVTILGLSGLAWAGCSSRTGMPTAPGVSSIAKESVMPAERSDTVPPDQVTYCDPIAALDGGNFSHPLRIDNIWSPLTPGTQYVLTGETVAGSGSLPHEVIFTVSDVVKSIAGIETVVLWDRDFDDGALAESELAFFAQDDLGNVWMMGEYPEEYDPATGAFQGAPSTWIPGIDGAIAGTLMLADPLHGTGYYLQGRSPSIRFLDCAKVYKTGLDVCVPVGCYTNVLETDERGPLEQNSGHQRKYYAPGIGNIRNDFVGDQQGEVLTMTRLRQLSRNELKDVRREVLRQDARGYQFSAVYAQTAPAR